MHVGVILSPQNKAQGWDTCSLLTHITSRAKTVQSLTSPRRKQQKSHAVLGSSLRPTASNSAKTVNGHNFFPLLFRRLRARGIRNFSLSPYFSSSSLFGRRRPHLNIAVIPFSAGVPRKHVSLSALEAAFLTKGSFTPLLIPYIWTHLRTHIHVKGHAQKPNGSEG